MSAWSLLLCEGPQDQVFLCRLATSDGRWQDTNKRPDGVPESFKKGGEPEFVSYLYLTHGDSSLVVASLGGFSHVVGARGRTLVRMSQTATSVGVIVDADEAGVAQRQQEVCEHFGPVLPAAVNAEPRMVVCAPEGEDDKRRFGLWVAPDCANDGSLDDVIRKAADALHPEQTRLAERFVIDLGQEDEHPWNSVFQKAVLGALGQRWRAGASLATALQERTAWMSPEIAKCPPFCDIAKFMADLLA